MNVLSLFDGISGGRLALKRANIVVDGYYASEINKYAIKVANTNFPDTVQLGNVLDIDVDALPDIGLLIGGSPCFVAGTKIITDKGYKNIEDITVGDMCLTHNLRYCRVTAVGNEQKETILLKAQGICETETTAEHPYYTRRMTINKSRHRIFSEPIWKQAGQLTKNDFVGMPIVQEEINPRNLTIEDCWLLGRYTADGHLRNNKRKDRKDSYQYQVIYSIGNDKVDYFKSMVTRPFSCYPHTKSVHRCIVSSMEFLNLIKNKI